MIYRHCSSDNLEKINKLSWIVLRRCQIRYLDWDRTCSDDAWSNCSWKIEKLGWFCCNSIRNWNFVILQELFLAFSLANDTVSHMYTHTVIKDTQLLQTYFAKINVLSLQYHKNIIQCNHVGTNCGAIKYPCSTKDYCGGASTKTNVMIYESK